MFFVLSKQGLVFRNHCQCCHHKMYKMYNIFNASHICSQEAVCNDTCLDELHTCMMYTEEAIVNIGNATRGQSANANWHVIRKHLITSSIFKLICHITYGVKTAINIINGPSFNPKNPPALIKFGQHFEAIARHHFLKAHKFTHRGCTTDAPGLCLNPDYPWLGPSADGILCYKECGKTLVETKCRNS